MLGRPAATILLLTAQRLVRADFTGSGKLIELWQEPRPDFDDLPSLAESALTLGGKPGRKVWALSAELWTQAITMPARTTAKLADADLDRALAFELETLSGANALESSVGHVALPVERQDERGFWVVQANAADRDQLDDLVRRQGSRLLGIAHPAGVPHRLSEPEASAAGAWQRVELWPDVIVCLHGEPGQPVQTHLISADPRQDRWHTEEEAWRTKVGRARRREMLLATDELVSFDEDGQPLLRQDENSALASLLTAWAAELAGKAPAVPLVRPAPRPLSTAGYGLIAAGIALGVALLCTVHYQLIHRSSIEAAQAEVVRLRQPVQQINALAQQASQMEKEIATLRQDAEALGRTNAALLAQRQRLPRLLNALSEHQPEDLLVQKIEGTIDQPAIHGVCLHENQANQLATRLARSLLPDWQVQETKIKGKEKLSSGGPFEFTITLKVPAPPARPPKK